MAKRNLTYGYCDKHRKRRYSSRKDAKRAIRYFHQKGVREYRCTQYEGWHVGHLPPATLYGEKTSREVYAKRTRPRRKTEGVQMDDTITLWYTVARGNADRPTEGQPFRVNWYHLTEPALILQLADDEGSSALLIPMHAISTARIGPGVPVYDPNTGMVGQIFGGKA